MNTGKTLGCGIFAVALALALAACPHEPATVTTPSAPTDFTATPRDAKVTLNWAVPANNGGSAITTYEVQTVQTDSNDSNAWDDVGNVLTTTVTDLVNGTPYEFKVRAVNAKGPGAIAIANATPTPAVQLDVPEDLDISGGMVTWTAVADAAPANGYTVKIYQPSADTYDEYAVSGTSYSLSSYDFTPAEEYWIYVKANGYETTTHEYLESDYCNRVPYFAPLNQVQLAVPANLILNGSTLTLSWDAVEHAANYTVKIFKVTPGSQFPTSLLTNISTNSAVISSGDNPLEAGVYQISVKADGYAQPPNEYRESELSVEITHYVGSTGLLYTAINGGSEYEVEQGSATDTDIVILPVYNGVPVTGIANFAFPSNPGSITSVFIPYSVRSIGDDAFENCTGITALTIPASVMTVGSNAFSGLNGDALYVPYADQTAAEAVWGTNWHSGIVDTNRIHYTAP